MQIGMIGLGRMGSSMARRLMRAGHACVVHDPNTAAVEALRNQGAMGSASLEDFATLMVKPRVVWLMVPATVVDKVLTQLLPLLEAGDIVIDGGNSYYRDDIRRAAQMRRHGVHYVDVGTSGDVAGLERGYCLMIGSEQAVVRQLDSLFAALAPGLGTAAPTPGRNKPNAKPDATADQGYLHCVRRSRIVRGSYLMRSDSSSVVRYVSDMSHLH